MIIGMFLIGFFLGLIYILIAEKLPLFIPEITEKLDNSWILNLFIASLNGLVFIISYGAFGLSYDFFVSLIIAALVIIIFLTDFKYLIILDSPLVVAGVLMLILRWVYFGFKNMGLALLSGIVLFIFMLIIGYAGKKIFKREALGGGDIKLALVMGLILGFRLGLIAIIFSSLIALPYALGAMMLNEEKEVPFGPFLIGSLAIVFIFTDKFMNLINFLF